MKVAIIGVGAVGAATAMAVVLRARAREVVLIDRDHARAKAVAADMHYGIPLSPLLTITAGGYDDLAGTDLAIITAGVNEKAGGATDRSDPAGRLRLLEPNVKVFEDIVPKLVRAAPNAGDADRLQPAGKPWSRSPVTSPATVGCSAPAPISTACASACTSPSSSASARPASMPTSSASTERRASSCGPRRASAACASRRCWRDSTSTPPSSGSGSRARCATPTSPSSRGLGASQYGIGMGRRAGRRGRPARREGGDRGGLAQRTLRHDRVPAEHRGRRRRLRSTLAGHVERGNDGSWSAAPNGCGTRLSRFVH